LLQVLDRGEWGADIRDRLFELAAELLELIWVGEQMKGEHGQGPGCGLRAGNGDILGFFKEALGTFLMVGKVAVEDFVEDGPVVDALVVAFYNAIYFLLQVLRDGLVSQSFSDWQGS
jgi:hypothetical protein